MPNGGQVRQATGEDSIPIEMRNLIFRQQKWNAEGGNWVVGFRGGKNAHQVLSPTCPLVSYTRLPEW